MVGGALCYTIFVKLARFCMLCASESFLKQQQHTQASLCLTESDRFYAYKRRYVHVLYMCMQDERCSSLNF